LLTRSTTPEAARPPSQSCGAITKSGPRPFGPAVINSSRTVPKSLTTTVAVTPFAFAQGAIAALTVGALPESAQMTRFFVAACAGAMRVETPRARAVRAL